jgi:hypothetical protein
MGHSRAPRPCLQTVFLAEAVAEGNAMGMFIAITGYTNVETFLCYDRDRESNPGPIDPESDTLTSPPQADD